MKKRHLFTGCLICLVAIFWLISTPQAAEYPSMTLKTTSIVPKGSFANKIVEWFVEAIEERTGGKVTFQEYYGASLLGGRETLEGMQRGIADFGLVIPPYTPGKLPVAYSNYAFPFAPRSAVTMVSAVWELYQEFPWMHQELTDHNIKPLYLYTVSDYGILSREPIETLKDLKGKRIVQLGGYFADWTKAGGVTPISGVTAGERYERLRTGVVDGTLLTPSYFVDFKEYEVAKNCIMLGLGARVPAVISINLKTWKKMTPELQKLFMDVGQEIQKRHAEATDKKMVEDLKFLQKHGVTYYGYLSNEGIDKWAAEVPDTPAMMCKSLEGKYPQIWKMARRFIELTEKEGHKWPRKFALKYPSN